MSVRRVVPIAMRLSWLVLIALAIGEFVTDLPGPWWATTLLPALVVLALMVATMSLQARTAAPRGEPGPPVEVAPPVTGRWKALNSPADKVPSHGTHAYGQTYAIDIVAQPETAEGEAPGRPGAAPAPRPAADPATRPVARPAAGPATRPEVGPVARPAFRLFWPVVRRNRAFPAFGAPLLAVADATVVVASDGQRDHLSRNSLPALAYLMLAEAPVRSIVGAHRIIGNHVILDLGGGTYAVYAHLRRGSLRVRAGDRVRAGQGIGRVGNSGNTTEPHLHFHLMDGPDPDAARGVPFTWRGVGVPANGETFTVVEPEERGGQPTEERAEKQAGRPTEQQAGRPVEGRAAGS
ncbi:M23 family metallopeptidase [Streptomyces californicus]|uniref:M23 family metallopeptidase n=1 Tax=Streptomyces californicus TaxID=67351 RepID=A0ABD7D2Q7_9ACTN|nr:MULTISPECIES: M23 family metallopeptidase [Streptomyces]QRV29032.1 M23 family metallopeptidase [Streptomyces californicus]QRV35363.1 M23 family metallopeptidase [Streptomyces californicus]QRV42446.1 M23 family metallopeptidase [Streptomyces californicus]QRV49127.1 M23 family metallopeptidase [Streptomyces californicus]